MIDAKHTPGPWNLDDAMRAMREFRAKFPLSKIPVGFVLGRGTLFDLCNRCGCDTMTTSRRTGRKSNTRTGTESEFIGSDKSGGMMSDDATQSAERLKIYCARSETQSPLAGVSVDPVVPDIRAVLAENERLKTIVENAVRQSVADCEQVIEIGKKHLPASVIDGAESMIAIVEMLSHEICRLSFALQPFAAKVMGKAVGE